MRWPPHPLVMGFLLLVTALGGYATAIGLSTTPPATELVRQSASQPPPAETDVQSPLPTTAPQSRGTEATPTTPRPSVSAPQRIGELERAIDTLIRSGHQFVGLSASTDARWSNRLDSFHQAVGITPAVYMFSHGWTGGPLDPAALDAAWDRGMLPVIAWEPWEYRTRPGPDGTRAIQPQWTLASIINGHHDEVIDDTAATIADWGHPVAIRLAHEMNGWWYPWSEQVNGNQPGEYVAMWRHVHSRFALAGAHNVIWIWSPNATFVGAQPMAEVYPGDAYVDWVGLVAYYGLGASPVGIVPTFAELFVPSIEEVREFTDKPIVLTEVGATDREGAKADWVTHFLDVLPDHPDVAGFIWFEGWASGHNWAIGTSSTAAEAFRTGVQADPDHWITADWLSP